MKLATKTIKIRKVLTEVTCEGSRGLISHRCLYNRKSLLLTMNPPPKKKTVQGTSQTQKRYPSFTLSMLLINKWIG